VSKGPTDITIAPPLAALGGWSDAEWFCSSILSDAEVVGFDFPPLAGVRKQSFHVIDRTTSSAPRSKKVKAAPRIPPKRTAGKLANILDDYGATRAVACCRSKFLFESGRVLFFADIPLAKVKLRSANKLRRELIDIGVRGCIVGVESISTTAMFWPRDEAAITNFIKGAVPEYHLHIDFDKAEPSLKGRPKPKSDTSERSQQRSVEREGKLLQEVTALRQQVEKLKRAQSALGAMEQLGLDDARLKSMLRVLHPDKHGGSEAANEAAKWLNNLREMLKDKKP
jgi:hypothetical protein